MTLFADAQVAWSIPLPFATAGASLCRWIMCFFLIGENFPKSGFSVNPKMQQISGWWDNRIHSDSCKWRGISHLHLIILAWWDCGVMEVFVQLIQLNQDAGGAFLDKTFIATIACFFWAFGGSPNGWQWRFKVGCRRHMFWNTSL